MFNNLAGADEGQRDGVCGRGGLLQSQQRHRQRRQRGERSPQHQVHTALILCPPERERYKIDIKQKLLQFPYYNIYLQCKVPRYFSFYVIRNG